MSKKLKKEPNQKPEKPRYRVPLPPEARVQIDVVIQRTDKPPVASKPKQDPDKIPTRITDHRTGEVTETNGQPVAPAPAQTSLALTPQEIEASQAKVREIMRNLAAGEPVEPTSDAEDQPADPRIAIAEDDLDDKLRQSAKPEPKHHIQTRDEDGKATSPDKEADIAQMKERVRTELRAEYERKLEDKFFRQLNECVDKFGITGAAKLFLLIFAGGAGCASVYWLCKQMFWS